MEQVYDFDEFFVSDDTVTLQVPIKGKTVPIVVKKAVGLQDRMAAEGKAVRVIETPDGKVHMESQQEVGAVELVYRCLVSWPFTTQKKDKDGQVVMDDNGDPMRVPVPITRNNVSHMLQDGAMYIYMHLQGMLEKMNTLAPFEKASEGGS